MIKDAGLGGTTMNLYEEVMDEYQEVWDEITSLLNGAEEGRMLQLLEDRSPDTYGLKLRLSHEPSFALSGWLMKACVEENEGFSTKVGFLNHQGHYEELKQFSIAQLHSKEVFLCATGPSSEACLKAISEAERTFKPDNWDSDGYFKEGDNFIAEACLLVAQLGEQKRRLRRLVRRYKESLKPLKVYSTNGTARDLREEDLNVESIGPGLREGDIIGAYLTYKKLIQFAIFFIESYEPTPHPEERDSLHKACVKMNIPYAPNEATAALILPALQTLKPLKQTMKRASE